MDRAPRSGGHGFFDVAKQKGGIMALEQTDGYQDGKQFAEEVINALEAATYDLSEPVPLSFFLYLPDEPTARRIGDALVAEGFEVDVDESAADDGNWLCWCDRTLVPTHDVLAPIGDRFLGLARDNNGEFDGWETDLYKVPGAMDDLLRQMQGEEGS
jgi:hypothetical protein